MIKIVNLINGLQVKSNQMFHVLVFALRAAGRNMVCMIRTYSSREISHQIYSKSNDYFKS